jgi:hypothetical protein
MNRPASKPAKRAALTKKPTRRAVPEKPKSVARVFELPSREWDKATELVRMFISTGWLENARAQSVMLISEPGSGKTELLDRFNQNPSLQYASDLTVRGLYSVLKRARQGAVSHLVATEFQKFFMRKSATADNTLGTLCQAIEEGIDEVLVGEKAVDFGGVQIGFIGAITHDTLSDKMRMLRETGFLSRVAVFDWEMSGEEMYGVMSSIGSNDKSDLSPVHMKPPPTKIHVHLDERLSKQFQEYVWKAFRDQTILRVFQRFRALAMGCALLDGRESVHAYDIEKVVSFDEYWKRVKR